MTFRKQKSDHTALKQAVTARIKGAVRSDTFTNWTHSGLAAEMHVNRRSAIEDSSHDVMDICSSLEDTPTAPGQGDPRLGRQPSTQEVCCGEVMGCVSPAGFVVFEQPSQIDESSVPFSPALVTPGFAAFHTFANAIKAAVKMQDNGKSVHAKTPEGVIFYCTRLHQTLTFPVLTVEQSGRECFDFEAFNPSSSVHKKIPAQEAL